MKKAVILCLLAALALCLCACGDKPEGNMKPLEPVTPSPVPVSGADAETPSPAAAADHAEASPADAQAQELDSEQYEKARACVGKSLAELYEAVGEPTGGADYAASCLQENAEDGMLYYGGFYVWTLRTQDSEIVHDVYLYE